MLSYDEVEHLRTRLASYLAQFNDTFIPLPSNFDSREFTIAAFDNFDHEENTISGLHETHDTVLVLFQKKTDNVPGKPNIINFSEKYSRSLTTL